MLDIHHIRAHTDEVRKNLEKRQHAPYLEMFDELVKEDVAYRTALKEVETLRAKRNTLSQSVAQVKDKPAEKMKLIEESKQVGALIVQNEKIQNELKEKIHEKLMRLPNVMEEDVPYGKDDTENVETKKWGEIRKFDFEVQHHATIAQNIQGVEFERAVKVAGTGFYSLKGPLALLDLALQRYALDVLVHEGFDPVLPPLLLNREAYEGVTDLGDFGSQLYKIEGEDLHLIATSEHPLTAQFMKETLLQEELPIKLAGVSPCFRREVGKHGLEERGLFRVHHFNKVEQVVVCSKEESKEWHQKMLNNTEKLFQGLEIPYRVVNVCTGDLGIVAAKKFDIEGWSPRENNYFELASLSNCTSYQAVRLGIRVAQKDGTKEYAHTLNATGVATSRMLRALLENHQTKEGGLKVPKALQPYVFGLEEFPPSTT